LAALQLTLQLYDFVCQLLIHAGQQLHLAGDLLAALDYQLLVCQLRGQQTHLELEAVSVSGELLDGVFEVCVFSLELCVAGGGLGEVVELKVFAEGTQAQAFVEEFGVVLP
jgi:hypothetical protein